MVLGVSIIKQKNFENIFCYIQCLGDGSDALKRLTEDYYRRDHFDIHAKTGWHQSSEPISKTRFPVWAIMLSGYDDYTYIRNF